MSHNIHSDSDADISDAGDKPSSDDNPFPGGVEKNPLSLAGADQTANRKGDHQRVSVHPDDVFRPPRVSNDTLLQHIKGIDSRIKRMEDSLSEVVRIVTNMMQHNPTFLTKGNHGPLMKTAGDGGPVLMKP